MPRSLAARTSLFILVLALVVGASFSALASWRLRGAEQERLIERVHELTATVESTVSVACFLEDATLAKEIAAGLLKNRIISGVSITAGHRVLHQLGGPAKGPGGRRGRVGAVTLPIHSPFDPGARVGSITLFVSHAEIEAQAIQYSRYTIWMLALQVVIVAGGTAFLVYLLATRPIKDVSDELHRLRIRTGMRLEAPSARRSDEIGQLVVDVNSLLSRLSGALSAERELRRERELSERRMRLVLEKADTGILVLDESGCVQSSNPAFARILGPDAARDGVSLAALLTPNGPLVAGLIAESLESGQPRDADLEVEVPGRGKIWVELSVNPLGPNLLQALVNDITERKRAESAAQELAMRDSLTGVLNRRGLDQAMATLMGLVDETRPLALLLVDLDFFKAVNDTHGHAAGDQVLREVAAVLGNAVRRTDVVARMGGDEFAVLLPRIDSPQMAQEIAATIIQGLSRPIAIGGGRTAHIGASVGIALTRNPREPVAVLMQRADEAMYAAKQSGRGRHTLAPTTDGDPTEAAA